MRKIILYPAILSTILLVISLLFFRSYLLQFFLISAMMALVPYNISTYLEHRRISEMEKSFPMFLRDLAEARRSGMTLPQAVKNASAKDYGALSIEVNKMSNQLSWGIPFPEVINNFSERVKKSEFMRRGLRVVAEAFKSGGDVAKVIDSIAESSDLIKDAEEEIKSKMYRHVMVMYVVFLLFIGIVLVLTWIMKPLVEFQKESPLFGGVGGLGMEYYEELFRSMLIILGLFNGIVAGQVAEGSITAGIKHSLIMTIISVLVSLAIL